MDSYDLTRWCKPSFNSLVNRSGPQLSSCVKRKGDSNGPQENNDFNLDSELNGLRLRHQSGESVPWCTKYSPSTVEDVAINPKKVSDVRLWLRSALCNDGGDDDMRKIAVLSGPAGCGKSTLIRLLAKENNLKVHEFDVVEDVPFGFEEDNPRVLNLTQIRQFESFLMDCCRHSDRRPETCNGMDIENFDDNVDAGSLILIDELPVGFYRAPDRYHEVLKRYMKSVDYTIVPIVFILSFNSSQELPPTFKLFPIDIVTHLNIEIIKFNSIAVSFLKKALQKVEYFQTMEEGEKKQLLESSSGDIRNLFNCLELKFKYEQNRIFSLKPKNKRTKLSQPMQLKNRTPSGSRDSALEVFHFIGKILHVKRRFREDIKYDGDYHVYPLHENVTNLLDCQVISSNRINLTLHQNYCKNVPSILNCASLCESLSSSDLFSDFNPESRFDMSQYSSEIAVRAAMYNLTPSLVDEDGDKIWDKIKKGTFSSQVFVPTFPSSTKQLIVQDKLMFHVRSKCQREIESTCRELIYKQIPIHRTRELFLDILPFITMIPSHSRVDAQVRSLQLFYCSIDEMVNYTENETSISSCVDEGENIRWIPVSAKKRMKSFPSTDLDEQLERMKKLAVEETYEEGDRIDRC